MPDTPAIQDINRKMTIMGETIAVLKDNAKRTDEELKEIMRKQDEILAALNQIAQTQVAQQQRQNDGLRRVGLIEDWQSVASSTIHGIPMMRMELTELSSRMDPLEKQESNNKAIVGFAMMLGSAIMAVITVVLETYLRWTQK